MEQLSKVMSYHARARDLAREAEAERPELELPRQPSPWRLAVWRVVLVSAVVLFGALALLVH